MNPETLFNQPVLDKVTRQLPVEMVTIVEQIIHQVRDIFSDALTTTYLAGAIIMAVTVFVALFLRAAPLVSAKDFAKPSDEISQ